MHLASWGSDWKVFESCRGFYFLHYFKIVLTAITNSIHTVLFLFFCRCVVNFHYYIATCMTDCGLQDSSGYPILRFRKSKA